MSRIAISLFIAPVAESVLYGCLAPSIFTVSSLLAVVAVAADAGLASWAQTVELQTSRTAAGIAARVIIVFLDIAGYSRRVGVKQGW